MGKVIEDVNVIVQFNHSGEVIPLRIQIKNEDGELQAFTIKGYRPVPQKGTYTTVDGVFICNSTSMYECQIHVNNQVKVVRLYFQPEGHRWFLGVDK